MSGINEWSLIVLKSCFEAYHQDIVLNKAYMILEIKFTQTSKVIYISYILSFVES